MAAGSLNGGGQPQWRRAATMAAGSGSHNGSEKPHYLTKNKQRTVNGKITGVLNPRYSCQIFTIGSNVVKIKHDYFDRNVSLESVSVHLKHVRYIGINRESPKKGNNSQNTGFCAPV